LEGYKPHENFVSICPCGKKKKRMKCNNLTPKQKDEEAKSPQFWLIGSLGNFLIKEACTKHIT